MAIERRLRRNAYLSLCKKCSHRMCLRRGPFWRPYPGRSSSRCLGEPWRNVQGFCYEKGLAIINKKTLVLCDDAQFQAIVFQSHQMGNLAEGGSPRQNHPLPFGKCLRDADVYIIIPVYFDESGQGTSQRSAR